MEIPILHSGNKFIWTKLPVGRNLIDLAFYSPLAIWVPGTPQTDEFHDWGFLISFIVYFEHLSNSL